MDRQGWVFVFFAFLLFSSCTGRADEKDDPAVPPRLGYIKGSSLVFDAGTSGIKRECSGEAAREELVLGRCKDGAYIASLLNASGEALSYTYVGRSKYLLQESGEKGRLGEFALYDVEACKLVERGICVVGSTASGTGDFIHLGSIVEMKVKDISRTIYPLFIGSDLTEASSLGKDEVAYINRRAKAYFVQLLKFDPEKGESRDIGHGIVLE